MPFEFTCPYCFTRTLVEESLAGKEGPCVGCGKKVVIPEPSARPAAVESPTAISRPRALVKRNMLVAKAIGVALACIAAGGIAVALLWPSVRLLKERRDRLACMTKLSTIAAALDAYAADHGTYPTPVVVDDKGKPLYSWRVLILPYVGEQELYAKFALDEAWDGPRNSLYIPEFPQIFLTPAEERNSAVGETSYMLVTGKGTLFPPSGPLAPSDVGDGLSNTLMLVETAGTGVDWAKPVDLDVSILKTQVTGSGSGLLQNVPNMIGGNHQGGATAVFADGQPAWLPDDIPANAVKAMITPNGGEDINTQTFR